mmetsp:Transcript_14502/g.42729  ORF Transcript_14502/g.42729 Transcript_14502/m.42729 type:complete len:232 (+) Transcript_14502:488-1183(+)
MQDGPRGPDGVGRGRDAERREADVAEILGHGLRRGRGGDDGDLAVGPRARAGAPVTRERRVDAVREEGLEERPPALGERREAARVLWRLAVVCHERERRPALRGRARRRRHAAVQEMPEPVRAAVPRGLDQHQRDGLRAVGARRRTGALVAGERPAAAVERHADVRRRLGSQRVDRRGRVRARDERLLWWVAPLGASRRGDEDPQHMRPGHFAIAWLRYLCQTTHQKEAAP